MTSEKIKNIAITVAAVVISVVSAITAYHVVELIKDTRHTLSGVNEKVANLADNFEIEPDSWLSWIIKSKKQQSS